MSTKESFYHSVGWAGGVSLLCNPGSCSAGGLERIGCRVRASGLISLNIIQTDLSR